MKINSIKQVKDYIDKKYPEYHDYEDDLDFCLSFFWYEKLGYCGCGVEDTARICIHSLLYYFSLPREQKYNFLLSAFGCKSICDNGLVECLAYHLDDCGLIWHGSSIQNSWLTDEGEMYLHCLWKKFENEEQVLSETIMNGCPKISENLYKSLLNAEKYKKAIANLGESDFDAVKGEIKE